MNKKFIWLPKILITQRYIRFYWLEYMKTEQYKIIRDNCLNKQILKYIKK